MSKAEERDKAAFLTDYRALCEKHGLMVIRVENDGEYWAFSTARLDTASLEASIQEMLFEPVRTIEWPVDKE
jgi:hypothetical protein